MVRRLNPIVESILIERYLSNLNEAVADVVGGTREEWLATQKEAEDLIAKKEKQKQSARNQFEKELAQERKNIADERKNQGFPEGMEDVGEHQALLSYLYKKPGAVEQLSREEYEKLTGSISKPLYISKRGDSYHHSSIPIEHEEGYDKAKLNEPGFAPDVAGPPSFPEKTKQISTSHLSYENMPSYAKGLQAASEHISDPEKIKQDITLGILTGGVGGLASKTLGAIATKVGAPEAVATIVKALPHAALTGLG